jgi:hypothetical protein
MHKYNLGQSVKFFPKEKFHWDIGVLMGLKSLFHPEIGWILTYDVMDSHGIMYRDILESFIVPIDTRTEVFPQPTE